MDAQFIEWVSDFVLPVVSFGVSETIELLEVDKELVVRSILLVKSDEVWDSVVT